MQPYLNHSWVRDFKRRQGWAWRSTDTDHARSDLGTTRNAGVDLRKLDMAGATGALAVRGVPNSRLGETISSGPQWLCDPYCLWGPQRFRAGTKRAVAHNGVDWLRNPCHLRNRSG